MGTTAARAETAPHGVTVADVARMQAIMRTLEELRDRQAQQLIDLRDMIKDAPRLASRDLLDMIRAYREIAAGDPHGLRRLERVLDDVDPSWRSAA